MRSDGAWANPLIGGERERCGKAALCGAQRKKALPLVLPWLRALVDGSTGTFAVPVLSPIARATLLAALSDLPPAEDSERQACLPSP